MSGRFCRVEPIDSTRHGEALYAAYARDREGRLWTYLPWGSYSGREELCARIDAVRASGARPEYALIDLASGKPFGQASYLNIDPAVHRRELALRAPWCLLYRRPSYTDRHPARIKHEVRPIVLRGQDTRTLQHYFGHRNGARPPSSGRAPPLPVSTPPRGHCAAPEIEAAVNEGRPFVEAFPKEGAVDPARFHQRG
jgi:hypothetical protein